MTDYISNPLPLGTVEAIGKDADHNKSIVLNDPRPHSQRLREVGFNGAVNAMRNYKQQHPGAAGHMTRITTLAFKPKPAGYTEYIDRLIARWLAGASTETNAATVQRIRDRFPNDSFASNLLNKPLSKGRREKIAANATQLGFKIDTRQYDTLAKIKAAALNGELATNANRPIVINATLNATHFAGLKIELHGKRQSIRFTHGGKRQRIYIDDLTALSEWLAVEGGADTGECSSNLLLQSIGILAQETRKPAELRQDALEAVDICTDDLILMTGLPGTLAQDCGNPAETFDLNRECLTGNIGPTHPEPTLTERIAALRAKHPADDAPAYPPDYDPLCDL